MGENIFNQNRTTLPFFDDSLIGQTKMFIIYITYLICIEKYKK